jgi:hypothetical protein
MAWSRIAVAPCWTPSTPNAITLRHWVPQRLIFEIAAARDDLEFSLSVFYLRDLCGLL